MENQPMKKEASPGVVIAAIVGLVAVVGLLVFLFAKSDPAAQAPNPPPTFNAAAKESESHSSPMGRGPGGGAPMGRGPNDPVPGRGPAAPPGPGGGGVVPR